MNLTRRRFLAHSGQLAAAASLLPKPSGAAESKRITAGFLGVAHSHAAEKVKIIRNSPDFELRGLYAETEELARAYNDIPRLSEQEVLRQCDLVVVESAVRDHARLANMALGAGKHVHVEKPPAVKLDDFQNLVALAQKERRLLQVGYMWRYNPGLAKALEAARAGWLGKVFMARATVNTQIGDNRRPEWAEFRGGGLFELGCHLVDPLVRLLGKPTKVTPFLQSTKQDKLADNVIAVFEYPLALATVSTATIQPGAMNHRSFEIFGDQGTATVKPMEQPILQLDLAKACGPYRAGVQNVPLPSYRRYVDEFRDLAKAIRGEIELPVSLDDEITIHETLLKASDMS